MHRSKTIILAIALLGYNLPLRAAEPSTRPAIASDPLDMSMESTDGTLNSAPPHSKETEEGKSRHGDRLRPGLRFMQLYNDKERSDAMQFMSQHSPHRFKFIDGLPDGEKKTGVQNFATRAYLSWMQLGKDNWTLYKVVMKRIEAEDEIFGLVTDLREAPPDKQTALTSQLHEKVEHLVETGIKERQLRLDDLSHTLKEEQQKLDQDNTDRKTLVEKRLKAILNDDHLGRLIIK